MPRPYYEIQDPNGLVFLVTINHRDIRMVETVKVRATNRREARRCCEDRWTTVVAVKGEDA